MKYIVLLGDGMADYPVDDLGGKTPLEAAHKPFMDMLAADGEVGLVQTIPAGMPPGSDTANLSVMGYDPQIYYSGRSPLEAVSMGIDLADDDIALRCNLVTLSDDPLLEATMVDHSAGEITTAEGQALIGDLAKAIDFTGGDLYPGVSYRHCLVLHHDQVGSPCTPPHDIIGQKVADYLPGGHNGPRLLAWMEASQAILRDHPINVARRAAGKNTADVCWFWGEGTRPALFSFPETYGMKGAMISAVDLLKGLALCAEMMPLEVEGANGTIDTNYTGKAQAALSILADGYDFVYIHVEAPDECGHQGNPQAKTTAIERIDQEVLGPIISTMRARNEPFSILVLPDHATPIQVRTHTSDPVPYILYRSDRPGAAPAPAYTEAYAKAGGVFQAKGHELLPRFLEADRTS